MEQKVKLGILGLGSRSTLFYLKELNRLYNQEKGGYSTCPFLLLNANFDAINSLLPKTSKELIQINQHYIEQLEKLDSEYILIPNITLHETIDQLVLTKKIIHPVHLAISKLKQKKWSKVVLFGSLHTMQSRYITYHFNANKIEVVLPSQKDMTFIDEFRKHVYSESETLELIKNYQLMMEKYAKIYPLVLACTELSVFKPLNIENVLDLAQIQIIEAIRIIK
jgi:aspartate racemase